MPFRNGEPTYNEICEARYKKEAQERAEQATQERPPRLVFTYWGNK